MWTWSPGGTLCQVAHYPWTRYIFLVIKKHLKLCFTMNVVSHDNRDILNVCVEWGYNLKENHKEEWNQKLRMKRKWRIRQQMHSHHALSHWLVLGLLQKRHCPHWDRNRGITLSPRKQNMLHCVIIKLLEECVTKTGWMPQISSYVQFPITYNMSVVSRKQTLNIIPPLLHI